MTTTNGFRFSVPGLVDAQNALKGITSGLMTVRDSSLLSKEELAHYDFAMMDFTKKLSDLKEPFNRPDLVVFHGIYMYRYIDLSKQLLRLNIPYIIVPRVSLTDGAQRSKKIKKTLGNLLFFKRFIKNSTRVQYLTENECVESRRFKKESFIVGNGIKLPQGIIARQTEQPVKITYLGRYAIDHKGLDLLIEAINSIKEILTSKNVCVDMYGSDSSAGQKFLLNKIKLYSLEEIVKVNSPIFGNQKADVLNNTDIFIATSRYEGHPMAVIEAMAYYIPCIITKGTNMLEELINYDAGWETNLDVDHIASTILKALDDKMILEKGSNARRLVEERCTWNIIANQTIAEYEKLI
jgi:glycosyltransferase involved in cell wall biosynthesis